MPCSSLTMGDANFESLLSSLSVDGAEVGKTTECVDSEENLQPVVTCLVVCTEQEQHVLISHVELLHQAGFQTSSVQCKDKDTFISMDVSQCNRLDLLVDSTMCSLLQDDQQLYGDVRRKFKEMEGNHTEIVVFNLYPPGDEGDDFSEVFYQIPRKARRRPSESVYNVHLPPLNGQQTAEDNSITSVQIGCTNKATINPSLRQPITIYQWGTSRNITKIVAPNEHSQLVISTRTNPHRPDMEEKIIQVMKKQQKDKPNDVPGVSSYVIEKGSIIIKLELDPGQMVTDQWLTTVLHALFTESALDLIPDGVSLDLDIDATVLVTEEEISKLALNSKVHENCVSKTEYEDLQLEHETLKRKTPNLTGNAKQISDWMDIAIASTPSGYPTGNITSSVYRQGEDLLQFNSKDCQHCTDLERKYKSLNHVEDLFVLHTTRDTYLLRQQDRRLQDMIETMGIVVSALLNSDGGEILVHLDGQNADDNNLEYFDELFSRLLSGLLGDSQSPTNVYSRHWLNADSRLGQWSDCVVIRIGKSQLIVTTNFNTMCSNDTNIFSPSLMLLNSILSRPIEKASGPQLRGLSLKNLHKDRSTHLTPMKLILDDRVVLNDVGSFVNHVWSNLKLGDCITSMSKIPGGGSYYAGINERRVSLGKYTTKEYVVEGIPMPFREELVRHTLFEKLASETCVLDKASLTFGDASSDLIDVAFHPVQGNPTRTVVLEVAICYVDGIVFLSKEGPVTYKVVEGKICRMHKTEWLERLRSHPFCTF